LKAAIAPINPINDRPCMIGSRAITEGGETTCIRLNIIPFFVTATSLSERFHTPTFKASLELGNPPFDREALASSV